MSDKPADSDNSQEGALQAEVQDYLDMLLTQATESPQAQISEALINDAEVAADPEHNPISGGRAEADEDAESEQSRRGSVTTVARSLTMVGGTAVRSINPKPLPAKPLPWAEPPAPQAPTVKPVTFKLPAVETRTAEPVEVPVPAKPKPQIPQSPPPQPLAPEPPQQKTAPTPKPVVPAVEVPEEVVEADKIAVQETRAATEPEPATPTASTWLENGRPDWAQGPFECLLFTVGGLTLAVPLVELGTIFPMTGELTPIFGQIDWFMGLLPVKHTNIKTVNTAKVVMPERYRESMADNFSYVISINGVDWGLAVDDVSSSLTLDPADVRWRGSRSKRPWLAGTVVEHMCALLDVSQLALMFAEQDQPRR